MATDRVWMTAAAQERLEAELTKLSVQSQDSVDQVRVRQLRDMLRDAEVERKPDDGLVEPGMAVTVRFLSDGSTVTVLLGTRELADLDPTLDLDITSPTSPLGSAIAGHFVGDEVEYDTPTGVRRVAIVAASPAG